MTAKTIEELLLAHSSGLASQDQKILSLLERFSDSTKRNDESIGKLEEGNARHIVGIAELNLKLALAEKEIADLKLVIELRRSYRWAMILLFLGAILSFLGSAYIAYYVKPK